MVLLSALSKNGGMNSVSKCKRMAHVIQAQPDSDDWRKTVNRSNVSGLCYWIPEQRLM